MFSTKEELLKFAKDQNVEVIDLKIVDLPGRWHHISMPVDRFDERTFIEGIGIDASSYPGYKKIEAGDMKIIPDPKTAIIDHFHEMKTLSIICDIFEPDKSAYSRCPRNIAKKAAEYLSSIGKGTAMFSPELEFYIFDEIRYGSGVNMSFYAIDSEEAFWNTEREEEPNLGYKFPSKGGYHGLPPADTTFNIRDSMVKMMLDAGIPVKYHHHEVGGPSQVEIEIIPVTLLQAADAVMVMKYIAKNVARQNLKTVTFMPKPLYEEAGGGMHVHQYLSDGKASLFYDEGSYAGLSELGLNYLGGLLKHGAALLAFTNPSTNSYKRLVPGYEAPVNLFFAAANRSAAIRIPAYDINRESERIEFRPPDATCNIYLALSAMLMAGLDGMENRIDPTAEGFGPFDVDILEMSAKERAKIKALPTSLEEALHALSEDHQFLLKGGIFTEDLIQTWINFKLTKEVEPVRNMPHPHEFALYYDI